MCASERATAKEKSDMEVCHGRIVIFVGVSIRDTSRRPNSCGVPRLPSTTNNARTSLVALSSAGPIA
jgi:hypothetical protein